MPVLLPYSPGEMIAEADREIAVMQKRRTAAGAYPPGCCAPAGDGHLSNLNTETDAFPPQNLPVFARAGTTVDIVQIEKLLD